MVARGHVAQDPLALFASLVRRKGTDLSLANAAIAPEARVVGAHATRLDAQGKAGQPRVVALE